MTRTEENRISSGYVKSSAIFIPVFTPRKRLYILKISNTWFHQRNRITEKTAPQAQKERTQEAQRGGSEGTAFRIWQASHRAQMWPSKNPKLHSCPGSPGEDRINFPHAQGREKVTTFQYSQSVLPSIIKACPPRRLQGPSLALEALTDLEYTPAPVFLSHIKGEKRPNRLFSLSHPRDSDIVKKKNRDSVRSCRMSPILSLTTRQGFSVMRTTKAELRDTLVSRKSDAGRD